MPKIDNTFLNQVTSTDIPPQELRRVIGNLFDGGDLNDYSFESASAAPPEAPLELTLNADTNKRNINNWIRNLIDKGFLKFKGIAVKAGDLQATQLALREAIIPQVNLVIEHRDAFEPDASSTDESPPKTAAHAKIKVKDQKAAGADQKTPKEKAVSSANASPSSNLQHPAQSGASAAMEKLGDIDNQKRIKAILSDIESNRMTGGFINGLTHLDPNTKNAKQVKDRTDLITWLGAAPETRAQKEAYADFLMAVAYCGIAPNDPALQGYIASVRNSNIHYGTLPDNLESHSRLNLAKEAIYNEIKKEVRELAVEVFEEQDAHLKKVKKSHEELVARAERLNKEATRLPKDAVNSIFSVDGGKTFSSISSIIANIEARLQAKKAEDHRKGSVWKAEQEKRRAEDFKREVQDVSQSIRSIEQRAEALRAASIDIGQALGMATQVAEASSVSVKRIDAVRSLLVEKALFTELDKAHYLGIMAKLEEERIAAMALFDRSVNEALIKALSKEIATAERMIQSGSLSEIIAAGARLEKIINVIQTASLNDAQKAGVSTLIDAAKQLNEKSIALERISREFSTLELEINALSTAYEVWNERHLDEADKILHNVESRINDTLKRLSNLLGDTVHNVEEHDIAKPAIAAFHAVSDLLGQTRRELDRRMQEFDTKFLRITERATALAQFDASADITRNYIEAKQEALNALQAEYDVASAEVGEFLRKDSAAVAAMSQPKKASIAILDAKSALAEKIREKQALITRIDAGLEEVGRRIMPPAVLSVAPSFSTATSDVLRNVKNLGDVISDFRRERNAVAAVIEELERAISLTSSDVRNAYAERLSAYKKQLQDLNARTERVAAKAQDEISLEFSEIANAASLLTITVPKTIEDLNESKLAAPQRSVESLQTRYESALNRLTELGLDARVVEAMRTPKRASDAIIEVMDQVTEAWNKSTSLKEYREKAETLRSELRSLNPLVAALEEDKDDGVPNKIAILTAKVDQLRGVINNIQGWVDAQPDSLQGFYSAELAKHTADLDLVMTKLRHIETSHQQLVAAAREAEQQRLTQQANREALQQNGERILSVISGLNRDMNVDLNQRTLERVEVVRKADGTLVTLLSERAPLLTALKISNDAMVDDGNRVHAQVSDWVEQTNRLRIEASQAHVEFFAAQRLSLSAISSEVANQNVGLIYNNDGVTAAQNAIADWRNKLSIAKQAIQERHAEWSRSWPSDLYNSEKQQMITASQAEIDGLLSRISVLNDGVNKKVADLRRAFEIQARQAELREITSQANAISTSMQDAKIQNHESLDQAQNQVQSLLLRSQDAERALQALGVTNPKTDIRECGEAFAAVEAARLQRDATVQEFNRIYVEYQRLSFAIKAKEDQLTQSIRGILADPIRFSMTQCQQDLAGKKNEILHDIAMLQSFVAQNMSGQTARINPIIDSYVAGFNKYVDDVYAEFASINRLRIQANNGKFTAISGRVVATAANRPAELSQITSARVADNSVFVPELNTAYAQAEVERQQLISSLHVDYTSDEMRAARRDIQSCIEWGRRAVDARSRSSLDFFNQYGLIEPSVRVVLQQSAVVALRITTLINDFLPNANQAQIAAVEAEIAALRASLNAEVGKLAALRAWAQAQPVDLFDNADHSNLGYSQKIKVLEDQVNEQIRLLNIEQANVGMESQRIVLLKKHVENRYVRRLLVEHADKVGLGANDRQMYYALNRMPPAEPMGLNVWMRQNPNANIADINDKILELAAELLNFIPPPQAAPAGAIVVRPALALTDDANTKTAVNAAQRHINRMYQHTSGNKDVYGKPLLQAPAHNAVAPHTRIEVDVQNPDGITMPAVPGAKPVIDERRSARHRVDLPTTFVRDNLIRNDNELKTVPDEATIRARMEVIGDFDYRAGSYSAFVTHLRSVVEGADAKTDAQLFSEANFKKAKGYYLLDKREQVNNDSKDCLVYTTERLSEEEVESFITSSNRLLLLTAGKRDVAQTRVDLATAQAGLAKNRTELNAKLKKLHEVVDAKIAQLQQLKEEYTLLKNTFAEFKAYPKNSQQELVESIEVNLDFPRVTNESDEARLRRDAVANIRRVASIPANRRTQQDLDSSFASTEFLKKTRVITPSRMDKASIEVREANARFDEVDRELDGVSAELDRLEAMKRRLPNDFLKKITHYAEKSFVVGSFSPQLMNEYLEREYNNNNAHARPAGGAQVAVQGGVGGAPLAPYASIDVHDKNLVDKYKLTDALAGEGSCRVSFTRLREPDAKNNDFIDQSRRTASVAVITEKVVKDDSGVEKIASDVAQVPDYLQFDNLVGEAVAGFLGKTFSKVQFDRASFPDFYAKYTAALRGIQPSLAALEQFKVNQLQNDFTMLLKVYQKWRVSESEMVSPASFQRFIELVMQKDRQGHQRFLEKYLGTSAENKELIKRLGACLTSMPMSSVTSKSIQDLCKLVSETYAHKTKRSLPLGFVSSCDIPTDPYIVLANTQLHGFDAATDDEITSGVRAPGKSFMVKGVQDEGYLFALHMEIQRINLVRKDAGLSLIRVVHDRDVGFPMPKISEAQVRRYSEYVTGGQTLGKFFNFSMKSKIKEQKIEKLDPRLKSEDAAQHLGNVKKKSKPNAKESLSKQINKASKSSKTVLGESSMDDVRKQKFNRDQRNVSKNLSPLKPSAAVAVKSSGVIVESPRSLPRQATPGSRTTKTSLTSAASRSAAWDDDKSPLSSSRVLASPGSGIGGAAAVSGSNSAILDDIQLLAASDNDSGVKHRQDGVYRTMAEKPHYCQQICIAVNDIMERNKDATDNSPGHHRYMDAQNVWEKIRNRAHLAGGDLSKNVSDAAASLNMDAAPSLGLRLGGHNHS